MHDPTLRLRTIEGLTDEIGALVRRRQELRAAGAAVAELESNRLDIARAQRELSRLLIERYLPAA